jgi:hypothetical protein
MTPYLCKILGHSYSYCWICKRCGHHAGQEIVLDIVREAVREAKKELATPKIATEPK